LIEIQEVKVGLLRCKMEGVQILSGTFVTLNYLKLLLIRTVILSIQLFSSILLISHSRKAD